LRGGVDKLVFTPGPAVIANGNYALAHRYKENIIFMTNGLAIPLTQQITRILAAPDILFTAEDLADTDTTSAVIVRTEGATSNDALNGNVILDGPGQIGGPIQIGFNKVGPTLFNSAPNFLGEGNGFPDFVWGSFDGSTNDPVVYPQRYTIRDLERAVFGNR
jgi:hypothetical protein